MRVYKNLFNKGFTLVELLVVIAIIAILFAVILIAINPAQRFKDSRNSRRLSDVKSIVEAATTYTADRRGAQLPDVPDYQCIGSKSATVVSDPGPRGHWKFDNNATDTAGGGGPFNGTVSGTAYSTAKLDQGIYIQSPLGKVTVPETIDDTMTNALTLEGWIKLDQKIEAGSFDHDQPIFDKGNYYLRLISDSGKLEAVARGTAAVQSATEYNSFTSDNTLKGINSYSQLQGSLYAGSITTANEGRILKMTGGNWSIISGPPSTLGSAETLTVYNNKLYSGYLRKVSTDLTAVYVFDGTNWQNTNLGSQAGAADVLALTRYKGKLYAGLGSASGASIWEYDGNSWRSSRSFSPNEATAVYSFAVFNGKLYAGTGGGSGPNMSHIYELNNGTWAINPVLDFTKDGVYSLAVYRNELYIGLGGAAATDGIVYKWDGATSTLVSTKWCVGGSNAGTTCTQNSDCNSNVCNSGYRVLSFNVYNGELYTGWGGLVAGDGKVYYYDSSTWTAVMTGTNFAEAKALYSFNGKGYVATRGSTQAMATIRTRTNSSSLESNKSIWLPNVWYHIAAIYDGSANQMNIFINGHNDASTTPFVSGNLFVNTKLLRIGDSYKGDSFFGTLDDLAVHHSALSEADIASHAGCYNLGQYLAPEYMGSLPIDPSSTVTDGTDTGYFISKDTGGVITITAPLTETSSSIPEIIKASR